VAIVPFPGESTLGGGVTPIIRATWSAAACSARSRCRRSPGATEASTINYAEWRARLADAVLLGSVVTRPDGRYEARFRLYDTVKQTPLGGIAYTLTKDQLRATAHRIADFVYEKLTGEKGVFSTRIAYVASAATATSSTSPTPTAPARNRARLLRADHLARLGAERPAPRLRVLREQEAGRLRPFAERRQSARCGELQGLELGAGLVADGKTLAVTPVARRRLAAVPHRPRRQRRAAPDQLERHRHRAALLARRQFIYFTSDRGGSPQIYRLPAAGGGEPQRVTFEGSYNVSPG